MESSTSTAQRIGIIIIAAVMIVGTLGSFFIMIFANQNHQIDAKEAAEKQEKFQKLYAEYNNQLKDYQAKVEAEAAEMGPKYFDTVNGYMSQPQPFDGSKVTELEKKDLKVGDGAEVKEPGDMRAYYIGWNKEGKVFDSSIKDGKLGPAFNPANAIQGWQQGVVGMKIGGVRELTIPSNLAYGDKKQSDDIPENSPLKFIIVAVEKSQLKEPEIPKELFEAHGGAQ